MKYTAASAVHVQIEEGHSKLCYLFLINEICWKYVVL